MYHYNVTALTFEIKGVCFLLSTYVIAPNEVWKGFFFSFFLSYIFIYFIIKADEGRSKGLGTTCYVSRSMN